MHHNVVRNVPAIGCAVQRAVHTIQRLVDVEDVGVLVKECTPYEGGSRSLIGEQQYRLRPWFKRGPWAMRILW